MDAFLLSLLHFNIQNCPGSTEGDASVQDEIIAESFEPVLAMLERHPTWHMNIEMQAYMVEILAGRHGEVLDRLRALAEAGQVELVSFQFSDQLLLAYPWRDQQKSLELTAEIFDEYDLPLSDVAFAAEGQFGEGMLKRMPEFGYHTAVLPQALAGEWWGADSSLATWRYDDAVRVVIGGGSYDAGTYRLDWDFFGDGEGYATGGRDCTLGSDFVTDEEALARQEAALVAKEEAGASLVTIGEFMAAHGADLSEELPAVVDGTWEPTETENFGAWMGGGGDFAEDDDGVLVANVRARHQLAAAEQVGDADPDLLNEAWRELLLGEVSDATGPSPLPTEVAYGKDHAGEAYALAQEAVALSCVERGANWLLVDIATGRVTPNGTVEPAGGEAVVAPFEVTFSGRTGTAAFTTSDQSDVTNLTVTVDAGADSFVVTFPWDGEQISTIPGLGTEVIDIAAEPTHADPISLPLSLGLLRLSEGVWLVKHTATTHLAARFSTGADTVSFRDETGSADRRVSSWKVVVGDATRAAKVAVALNDTPVVQLSCPPGPMTADLPCGCASGGAGAAGIGLLLAGAALGRRLR